MACWESPNGSRAPPPASSCASSAGDPGGIYPGNDGCEIIPDHYRDEMYQTSSGEKKDRKRIQKKAFPA